jgi:hypothetical protein
LSPSVAPSYKPSSSPSSAPSTPAPTGCAWLLNTPYCLQTPDQTDGTSIQLSLPWFECLRWANNRTSFFPRWTRTRRPRVQVTRQLNKIQWRSLPRWLRIFQCWNQRRAHPHHNKWLW